MRAHPSVAYMSELKQAVGRYELLRELGRGGMATVYAARQVDLNRLVALKELGGLRNSDPSFAQRFLREAQLAGSLSHPSIVTVHDYFDYRGIPYIAMEYLERGSLRPYVGRMTLPQIGGVLEGVLAGLSYAEKRDIVHRDLKPENLLVTGDGRVKIADFGIAKATNKLQTGGDGLAMTSTGVAVGTPNYMAPEQAVAQGVGPWTDLYAVGILAFEFFAGRTPFSDTENVLGVLLRQVNETIPPLTDLDPGIDPSFSDWIERMVAKEPTERPASAADAWDEIEESFIALLGPRWRREARLAPLPDFPLIPPGPATPPPPGAPTGPLTEAHLGVPIESYPPSVGAGGLSPDRETVPLAQQWGATTMPPRVPEPPPPPPEPPRSRKWGFGSRGARFLIAGVAVVAAAAAILGRSNSSQPPATQTGTGGSVPAAAAPGGTIDKLSTNAAGSAGTSLATKAKNARALASQYDNTAAQVAQLSGASVPGSPLARLVTALRNTAAAYRAAAAAAEAGDAAGYAAAMKTVAARKKEVDKATAATRTAAAAPTIAPAPSQTPASPATPQQQAPSVQRTPCSGDSVSDDPSDESCGAP